LDSDIIFSFDSKQVFKHVYTCLRRVKTSSIKIKEDGSVEIPLKLKVYIPKTEKLKPLCTELANKLVGKPGDTVNAFIDLFIRWRYRSDLCDYARLYDGKFKSRKQANTFAVRFVNFLFKKGLIRVSDPKLLTLFATGHFPKGWSLENVCFFKDGWRTGLGRNIKLSVNLKRLAEEGFYEIGFSKRPPNILKKENGLRLIIKGLGIPEHKIDLSEQHGKEILNVVSRLLKPVYKPKRRLQRIITRGARIRIEDERFVSPKTWKLTEINGDEIYVEEGTVYLPKVEELKKFKLFCQRLVELMGGNPETVNICVADEKTDGYNTKGQLFFNIARKDDPYRWIIVIARELAYNISRKRYPHMNAMTELLVDVIKHWHEVEEICKEVSIEKSLRERKT